MATSQRRVALITSASDQIMPDLAEVLAAAGHDLVLHAAGAALAERLKRFDVEVEIVAEADIAGGRARGLGDAQSCNLLVERVLARFGRLDAAALNPRSSTPFAKGRLMAAELSQLTGMYGYFDSTFHLLRAVIPAMKQGGGGQIVVFTSAAGKRPEAGWSLYGAVRAGQSFLVQAAALEHAADNVQINVIGSKNVVWDDFPLAPAGAIKGGHIERGAWSTPLEAETPMHRLGAAAELAAFASVLLDGRSRFQTGQYFGYSGGWDIDSGWATRRDGQ
jgi:NAD(P)-dependent dehydrogenase (short-subunit alcohol dehydrogenase family)